MNNEQDFSKEEIRKNPSVREEVTAHGANVFIVGFIVAIVLLAVSIFLLKQFVFHTSKGNTQVAVNGNTEKSVTLSQKQSAKISFALDSSMRQTMAVGNSNVVSVIQDLTYEPSTKKYTAVIQGLSPGETTINIYETEICEPDQACSQVAIGEASIHIQVTQ